ncbi:gene 11-1 protein [Burkholderia pseudomallei]|nr:gene 11-1 protein [Burkholderia pseudomallei]
MPVEVDVDSEATELLAELMPDEADVESEVSELLVLLRPVESEPMPVEVDVDSEATELLAELMRCWWCSGRWKASRCRSRSTWTAKQPSYWPS